jgi:hypothetical protein
LFVRRSENSHETLALSVVRTFGTTRGVD